MGTSLDSRVRQGQALRPGSTMDRGVRWRDRSEALPHQGHGLGPVRLNCPSTCVRLTEAGAAPAPRDRWRDIPGGDDERVAIMWRSCGMCWGRAQLQPEVTAPAGASHGEAAPPGPHDGAGRFGSFTTAPASGLGSTATDLAAAECLRQTIQRRLSHPACSALRTELPWGLTAYPYAVNARTLVKTRLAGDTKATAINANRIDDRYLVMEPPPGESTRQTLPMLRFLQAMLEQDVRVIIDLSGRDGAGRRGPRHLEAVDWQVPYLGRFAVQVLGEPAPSAGTPVTPEREDGAFRCSRLSLNCLASGGAGARSSRASQRAHHAGTAGFASTGSEASFAALAQATRLRLDVRPYVGARQRASHSASGVATEADLVPRPVLVRAQSSPAQTQPAEPAAPAPMGTVARITHLQVLHPARLIHQVAGLRALAMLVAHHELDAAPGSIALQDEDGGMHCAMVLTALALHRAHGLSQQAREQLIVDRFVELCQLRGEHMLADEPQLAALIGLAREGVTASRHGSASGPDRD